LSSFAGENIMWLTSLEIIFLPLPKEKKRGKRRLLPLPKEAEQPPSIGFCKRDRAEVLLLLAGRGATERECNYEKD